MELIIEIPDAMYEDIKSGKDGYSNYVHTAVRNGVPIPKGHGRLIDVSQLLTVTECKEDGTERCFVLYEHIEEAEAIIEAESEGEK